MGLNGGRYGIRTHGDPEATTAFEAAPFVRSGNLPPQRLPASGLRRTGGAVPGQCGISAIGKVSSTSVPRPVKYTWFSTGLILFLRNPRHGPVPARR